MRRFFLICAAFCAIFFALSASSAQDTVPREQSDESVSAEPAVRFLGFGDKPALRADLALKVLRARRVVVESAGRDWPGTALVIWTPAQTFGEKTGLHPENSAAAASANLMSVWINAGAWERATDAERQQTLTHEFGHLILPSLPGGKKLPLWANEGIVMHLAKQWSWDEQLKLMQARFFGGLPKLADLEESFPRGGEAEVLAYRMSYSAVDTVAQDFGDEPGSVTRLVARLANEQKGPQLSEEFWDAFRRDGWEIATKRNLGSRLSTGLIVMTSGGTVFLIIAVLVLIAWWKVKSRNARKVREEEAEEAWAESLTDEDVQDIYGDRDERWKDGES